MATHSQTYLGFQNDPNGSTKCGYVRQENDDSPTYLRATLAVESAPTVSRFTNDGGFLARAFFELQMADLVTDGYVVGRPIVAAYITFPMVNAAAPFRFVCDPGASLADSNTDLFNRIGPSAPAWSDMQFASGTGTKTLKLNAFAMNAISAMKADDVRVIGMCLADESVNLNCAEGDPQQNYVLTVETV